MATPALNAFGIEVPWEARTLEGFRAWVATLDERAPRVSFARGRMHVEMSPQNYATHEKLVAAINAALRQLARELDLGEYYFPPSWVTHEPTALSTEPDGFLVSWGSLERGDFRINPERPTEALGRPDMVLEVVSVSSERKDLIEHVEDYALAGVREYWIADARAAELVFRILHLGPDNTYAEVSRDDAGWITSPLWGRRFRLQRLANRLGQPDFTLDVAPLE